jgi:hypothetical protein
MSGRGGVAGPVGGPWRMESDQMGAVFGWSLGTAGDVNGDGYTDVIVGALGYDNGQRDEGRGFVYHGSEDGLSQTPDWTAESDQADAGFGSSVGAAGDVNGDGYDDVIVGASAYDNGQRDEGRAFVYHGSASGLSLIADWTAESDERSAGLGVSVATAGDVNGDGYDDVIVGSPGHDIDQSGGGAFVYHGSATGLTQTPDWTAESDQAFSAFGSSVSTAGDVNGDGYSDAIVGAFAYDNGHVDEGRVFAFHGSATGLSSTPDWTGESDQTIAAFGNSVATAGDVNGDGHADVTVGAPYYSSGQLYEGRAFLYVGSPSGLSANPDWTAEVDQPGALFGGSAGTAGDMNGDGYADVIVGASYYDHGQDDEGVAFIYHGSIDGLESIPSRRAEGDQHLARFGYSAGTAGDANGDGYADVIVGAFYYDHGQDDEGVAFVWRGRAS